ncbi:PRC-barrel domain-containing protein [Streptomyces olivoreticuli]|uniref:PRC-barrel domain-containing protein n=1 Tax=Streptomyces olivoreticuli TaxID=68246 RepID=UPI00265AF8F7|nr:PRC-barrel domain-containing protein [Streptomyces olivoreticuli]WKK23172.1 PRC-barrel domain-containing protein [Streptomyces olivoreticuli]
MGGTVQTDIDPRSLIGRKAFDRDGAKIGTVDEVYLDDETGEPEWAAVRTGLFSRDAFVPLEPSEVVDDTLRVPYERALIKDAPDFGVGRHLSPEQELQLYHHYGLALPTAGSPPATGAASGTAGTSAPERADEGLGTVNGSGG